MITTTSLMHPSMQIKIKSCRVQACMGLIGIGYGTVEINGVAWDWTQSHDRFRFFPAE